MLCTVDGQNSSTFYRDKVTTIKKSFLNIKKINIYIYFNQMQEVVFSLQKIITVFFKK